MTGIVNLRMLGRFGNQLFQYAFARAYAEAANCELRHDPWIGERFFDIPSNPIRQPFKRIVSDLDFTIGTPDIEIRGYCQSQSALIYTRSQVQSWLAWRPEAIAAFAALYPEPAPLLAHLRRGDYFGYGYPVVSVASYENACRAYNLPVEHLRFISEEHPSTGFDPPFILDFWRMTQATVLLRANSTFSWWAATLAPFTQRIYSPLVFGLRGGIEHDATFVPGNWPRFCNLDFVTDLHLRP